MSASSSTTSTRGRPLIASMVGRVRPYSVELQAYGHAPTPSTSAGFGGVWPRLAASAVLANALHWLCPRPRQPRPVTRRTPADASVVSARKRRKRRPARRAWLPDLDLPVLEQRHWDLIGLG